MNVPLRHTVIDPIDALLVDVARRIQLSPGKHDIAERNFAALCRHVDREGSPLSGKVIQCYPSGSFATGTASFARIRFLISKPPSTLMVFSDAITWVMWPPSENGSSSRS